MQKTPIFIFLISLLPTILNAASLVEIRDQYSVSKIYVEGQKGRMESGDDSGYLLIDGGNVYSVMPEQQMVMEMSGSPQGSAAGGGQPVVAAKLIREGSGPKIAGYATDKYRYTANGQSCGTLFTSKAAMQDAGMEHMLATIRKIAQQAGQMAAQFRGGMRPCEMADQQLMERVKDVGMPLRTLDANGQVESEVLRVVKQAKLPPNAFTYPKNFQVRNMAQMQQQAQQQMRSNMPNLEEMMKQMPQDGSLPPQAQEQMRKMQEMMKRYQQQQ